MSEPRAVVCVDLSLRFGEFAELVQAHAEDLRSQSTMEAVLSIDRALKVKPYTGVEDIERRVLAFPRVVVPEIWDDLAHASSHMLHLVAPEQFAARVRPLLANPPA